MAVTARTFRDHHPEFEEAPDEVVEAQLSNASTRCPASVWGDWRDEGIELYAARGIALSPHGRDMRLGEKESATVYDMRIRELEHIVAVGGRVI